ncbi:4a-hydroxytetrahydrobiopterin dehydratase [Nakamurella sp. YIM 132087]|uniref:4a-hydroxytetrahydrobiopterin dehydratase n=1 Tax=Nakamurella alba TaxID=2665158 RepID=A0A7K1FTW7_9ACTN|nr:VOC family protein [Nakamurella alba]MTD16254.1 4a-hydroxytetrahydrobiopterin dehydratase [Nakamurella alba]
MSDSYAARVPRPEAAATAAPWGWGYLLGTLTTSVSVGSMADAVTVAQTAVRTAGPAADGHLRVDLRPDRCELTLQTASDPPLTGRDLALASGITEALARAGFRTATAGGARAVQQLEIAIDALDIPAVLPFWQAVLGYVPDPEGPDVAIVDPTRTGPAVWFQQMDESRRQRNRIHLDITVTEDEAQPRLAAALAAGGTLVSDAAARAFWILADAEGNEVCICTWQDRD